MAEINDRIQVFTRNQEHFAEIMDYGAFGGFKVINPKQLKELDSVSTQVSGMKIRDVIKQYGDGEAIFAIVAIENQQNVHYAMPLRNLVYDLQQYEKQRLEIQQRHKKDRDLREDEWLSKFCKSDKLIPVITLVVYFGDREWDGPRSLWEMLSIPEHLEPYKNLFADYQLNLLEINKIKDISIFSDDVRLIFGVIKNQNDEEKLNEFFKSEAKLLEAVSEENCKLIECVTKTEIDWEKYKTKDGKEVEYNMCRAIEDMKKTSEEHGKNIGKDIGKDQFGKLVLKLVENQRTDDLILASEDPVYREQLIMEFAL